MIKLWINSLAVKQIVIIVVLIVIVVIGTAWYINYALGGDEVDTDVHHFKAESSIDLIGGARGGNEFFDPTKKDSLPSTTGKLATKLDAKCDFDSREMKVSCEAHRTSMQSTLNWFENYTDTKLSGEEEGIFEYIINSPSSIKILVILEECIVTTCKLVETTVDISETVP